MNIFDLVVLVLVILILAVYRQMDAKNRSLEKLKRFGDKLMGDLDAISQEKAVQLRDMAIEVDVHTQASKAAMERMQQAEDGLNARSALIEDMQARIDSYESALRELIGMTQKAEENVSRLRDESAYIDKVGRRIRQAAGQLQQLQDRIPGMLGEFQQSNQVSLAAMGEQVAGQVQGRLAEIEGQVEMSGRSANEIIVRMRAEVEAVQEDLGRRADAYRRAFDDIESDYRARLEEVARQGLSLETESLRRVREDVDGQVAALRRDMAGWEAEMAARNSGVQQEFDRRVAEQDATLENGLQRLAAFMQEAQEEILTDLRRAQEKAAARVEELHGDVRGMIEQARDQLAEEINASRQEVNGWQVDVQAANKAMEQDLLRNFDDSRERLEERLRALGEHVERVRGELDGQIEESRRGNERTLDEFQSGMHAKVEGLEGGIYQVEQDLAEKLSAAQERGKTLADTLLTRISQDVDAKTESMREAINQRVEYVNASVQASHDKIDESFNELRGRVDGWIDTSRNYMSSLDEQVRNLNEESRAANQEHRETIQSHIAETQSRLNAYEQGLSSRVAELEGFITRAEDMVRVEFERLHNRASDLAVETGRDLDAQAEQRRSELVELSSQRFDALRTELDAGLRGMEGLIGGVRSQVQEWSDRIDGQVGDFEEQTRQRESRALQGFEEQIRQLAAAVGERSQEVQAAISQELQGYAQTVKATMADNQSELDQTRIAQKKLGSEVADTQAALQRYQGELQDAFAQLRDELAERLDSHAGESAARIKAARAEMAEQAEQVQADLERWRDGLGKQVEELRSLAQGLHHDTLGGIQDSITAVQKQAQELYNRINTEIAQSLSQHEEKIMGLTSSTESDIRRLQNLSGETQARIVTWQDQLAKTEGELTREIQEIRDNAKAIALKGSDELRAQLTRRQDELAQSMGETLAKLKSDIAHSRGDLEQDTGFLKQQIEQWKAGFQDQLKILQDNSKNIEAEALEGLKERIEGLREEARQMTRKAQDEIQAAVVQQQAQVQTQVEVYGADIRRVQGMNKELQSQIADLEAEIARAQAKTKDTLGDIQAEAAQQAAILKDNVKREVEERHRVLLGQVKAILEQMGAEVNGSKTNVDRELALIQQQLEQSKAEMAERFKALAADGANLRRETMGGFQERVDALRDEARKMTGNVKSEIQAVLAEHQAQVLKQLQETEAEFSRMQDMGATSQLRFQEIQDIFNKAESMAVKEFEGLKEKTRQLAEANRSQIQSDLQRQRDEALALARQQIEAMNQDIGQARKLAQTELAGLSTEFQQYGADLRERFEALSKQGTQLQDQTLKSFQADLAKVNAQTDGIAKTILEQASRGLEQHRQQIASLLEAGTADLARARANQSELQFQINATGEDLAKKIVGLEGEIARFAKEMAERIERSTEQQHNAVMVDVERRIKDYEREIAYRIEKIETVNDDISNLESNLRESMDRLTGRLREDLDALGGKLRQQREADLAEARRDMEGISLQMLAVEKDLDGLKNRAYDNVSEKLKVFEDEFFVDLKQRSDQMNAKIAEWRDHVQQMLYGLEESTKIERGQLEERYNQALKERLNELAARLGGQVEKVESDFQAFQSSLNERMGQAELGIQSADQAIKDEMRSMQTQAMDGLQREFTRMNQDVDNRIRSYEREVETRLNTSDTDFKAKSSDLQAMMETARSDMAIWQNQVLQQMKGTEAQLQQDFAGFRNRANQTIGEIKDDFVRQRDELIVASTDERTALRQEIQAMGERIGRLQTDLEYKSREAMEVFGRDYAGFQADIQRQNREVQEDVEERMKDFRSFVGGAREEFEAMQRRLFGKLDEDAKALDLSLRDIDKRMKNFQSQTKLFERADSLQNSLSDKIEQLRADIQAVDEQRKSILDLDPYLAKVKKLAEEVNEKITKLNAEKKRLDGLDDDYKKLMSISSVVDQKLAQVTASNDTLTEIQLSLRHLEEVQREVEGKFTRLEKKSDVLDATTDGIEKNFQLLQDLDQKVGGVKSTMSELPRQVNELAERVASLSAHKKEADAALKNVTNLDKILKDVEQRIGEMNKSRDWIARTETRFNEIIGEADEKVAVLTTMVRKEVGAGLAAESGKGPAVAVGGPAPSVREVVLKLAQQGWRVDEIARTTKLSRGEVELILEMGTRA